MKITGDRSTIWVEINGKIVKIEGELTTTPAFYAEANSIKNWEFPFENILISSKEKEEIIQKIEEYSKKTKVKIIFD